MEYAPPDDIRPGQVGTLIDEGLAYVILSPYQAERVRPG